MLYEYECSTCGKTIIIQRVVKDRDLPVYCTCTNDQEKKEMIRCTVQKFSTTGLDHNVT